MKLLVVLALVAILFALGSALLEMLRDREDKKRTVKALTWRIGLSVALFVFLLVAYQLGWITPHDVQQ